MSNKTVTLLTFLALFTMNGVGFAARGPKDKLSTPVYEDSTNRAEIFTVTIGTYSSASLYTPRQSLVPVEERRVFIQNLSAVKNLNLTTWSVTDTEFMSSTSSTKASFVIRPSTSYAAFGSLELPAGTTFYGRFDRFGGGGGITDSLTGASSDCVRIMLLSVDQSLRP